MRLIRNHKFTKNYQSWKTTKDIVEKLKNKQEPGIFVLTRLTRGVLSIY